MMSAGVASVRTIVGNYRLWGGRTNNIFASELTVELNLKFNLDFDVYKSGYFKRQFTTKVKADKKSKVLYPY